MSNLQSILDYEIRRSGKGNCIKKLTDQISFSKEKEVYKTYSHYIQIKQEKVNKILNKKTSDLEEYEVKQLKKFQERSLLISLINKMNKNALNNEEKTMLREKIKKIDISKLINEMRSYINVKEIENECKKIMVKTDEEIEETINKMIELYDNLTIENAYLLHMLYKKTEQTRINQDIEELQNKISALTEVNDVVRAKSMQLVRNR